MQLLLLLDARLRGPNPTLVQLLHFAFGVRDQPETPLELDLEVVLQLRLREALRRAVDHATINIGRLHVGHPIDLRPNLNNSVLSLRHTSSQSGAVREALDSVRDLSRCVLFPFEESNHNLLNPKNINHVA